MRILADIENIEISGKFYRITACDVKGRHHVLFFTKEKMKMIISQYDDDNIVGRTCILELTGPGRVSSFIQTDLGNEPILTDNNIKINCKKEMTILEIND